MEPINSYVEDLFKTQTSNGATIYTDVKDILQPRKEIYSYLGMDGLKQMIIPVMEITWGAI